MSNSSKQRTFIKNTIERLRDIGVDVELEKGKHYKATLTHDGKKEVIIMSSAPSSRNRAQRDALGDIRRALRNLNVDPHALRQPGLLHFIVGNDQRAMHDPENDGLAQRMEHEGYGYEEIAAAIRSIDALEHDIQTSFGEGGCKDLSILTPANTAHAQKNIPCTPLVAVACAERGSNFGKRYFRLRVGLEALLGYYDQCLGSVRIGVVVTNVWRPFDLLEYSLDLDYFESVGIKTVFILRSGSQSYPIIAPWK
jgi:hypothetical protein